MSEYKIDAKGQTLGRLATKIAHLLQDKNKPSYAPRLEGENMVIVSNVDKIRVTGNKAQQKVYYRHSGNPGHLKSEVFEDVFAKYPERVLMEAVRGMLPRNKLRTRRLKRLVIETSEDKS